MKQLVLFWPWYFSAQLTYDLCACVLRDSEGELYFFQVKSWTRMYHGGTNSKRYSSQSREYGTFVSITLND